MRRLFLTLVWFAALAGIGQISARPSWWAGDKPALIEASKKSGRPIVVFFRDDSPESLKMEQETLDLLTPEQTGAFLWVYADLALVESQSLAKFHHVEEFPTLLLRGPMGFELARVAGFVSPEKLMESLRQFPSEDEAAYSRPVSFGDGKIFTHGETSGANPSAIPSEHAHSLHESFDKLEVLEQSSISIQEQILSNGAGAYVDEKSGAKSLVIESHASGFAGVVLDLSNGLKDSDVSHGYLDVEFVLVQEYGAWVVKFPWTWEIVLGSAGKPPPSLSEIANQTATETSRIAPSRYELPSGSGDWPTFKLRMKPQTVIPETRLYLALWLDDPRQKLRVDDIRVRIVSSDDPSLADPFQADLSCKDCSYFFKLFDRNEDIVLTMDEIPPYHQDLIRESNKSKRISFEEWFLQKDKNHDGVLQPLEFEPLGADRHQGLLECGTM